jgi:uncharacterized membrane protein
VFLAVLLSLAVWFGPAPTSILAGDDLEDVDDPCAGEMQWMLGWCMENVSGGDVQSDVESVGTVASLAVAAASAPAVGEFIPIDVPGATATRAFGINPQGDIVGSYDSAGTHGFLLRNSDLTTIDYPGAAATEAWGINARGDIIGRYTRSDRPGRTFGFRLANGQFTDISIGAHRHTLPTKVGASGEVVGCFHETSGFVDMFGYVQRGSDVTLFALPSTPGLSAMHNGITPGGRTVVGLTFPRPGEARGYALSGTTLTYLDFPGSGFTQAWDVNPRGTIVGQYNDRSGRTHGFFRDEDGYVSIDAPGALATRALGINPEGDIVGMYVDRSGGHGFLLRK